MNRLLLVSVTVLVLITGCTRAEPVRALLVTASRAGHDIETLGPLLESRLEQSGEFDVTLLAPPGGDTANAQHLAVLETVSTTDYDVVLTYIYLKTVEPGVIAGLERYVEGGGGLVALHASSASFVDSSAWMRLLGGRFVSHSRGTHDLLVELEDADHPITAGIDNFSTHDEEYCHDLDPQVPRKVLARFGTRPETSDCPDGPDDLLWVRVHGDGRIAYLALGHDTGSWDNPAWQELVIRSTRWASASR